MKIYTFLKIKINWFKNKIFIMTNFVETEQAQGECDEVNQNFDLK